MNQLILPIALLLAACATEREPTAAATSPAPTSAQALLASRYPLSQAQVASTSESIYLGNLDARIASAEATLAQHPDDARRRAILAASLEHRFRILGKLPDAERAVGEIERAISTDASLGDAHVVHAGLLSTFHRFDEARAALARAREHGANDAIVARLERDLALALGDYDRVRDDFVHSNELAPDFFALAHRADLRVALGDLDGATRLYRSAQDLYGDVDPLPLAWLYTQQGIALLRFGDAANARRFFAAAHARLPSYVLAAEHLAETLALTEELEASRVLYAKVVAQTGNPEFIAALAEVEAALGHEDAARAHRAEAARVYNDWLARHPAAYAQHAAEFHLERGNAARAYALAAQNLALRRDAGSLILHAQAAEAAGALRAACRSREAAVATGLKPPELSELDALTATCDATTAAAPSGLSPLPQ